MQRRDLLLASATAGSLLLLGACRYSNGVPYPEETSVNPGINDNYVGEDFELEDHLSRLESEKREIYRRRADVVEHAPIHEGDVVADIGSGTGIFLPLLAAAVGESGKVLAVDIVPDFLTLIDERNAELGLDNVETHLCTERSVELPRASIDVAFVCDVYHHFEYPKNSLASIHKALRPGGELFVVDFHRIEGKSTDFILGHVRAGQEVFRAEIEEAGFEFIDSIDLLETNYMMRFERPE